MAGGHAKREALHAACFGPVTPAVLASALQSHLNVTVYADEAAGTTRLEAQRLPSDSISHQQTRSWHAAPVRLLIA